MEATKKCPRCGGALVTEVKEVKKSMPVEKGRSGPGGYYGDHSWEYGAGEIEWVDYLVKQEVRKCTKCEYEEVVDSA